MAEPASKPVGRFPTFAACVAANQDKGDPEAFCGAIEEAVGKFVDDTWEDVQLHRVESPRIFVSVATSPRVDKEQEAMDMVAVQKKMEWFVRHGTIQVEHGKVVIGFPFAWKLEGDKILTLATINPDPPGVDQSVVKNAWDFILKHEGRLGVSWGGTVHKEHETEICDDEKCWTQYSPAEFMELSITTKPSNPDAKVVEANSMVKSETIEEPSEEFVKFLETDPRMKTFYEEMDKQRAKPSKAWWARCIAFARGAEDIDNVERFCGALWFRQTNPQLRLQFGASEYFTPEAETGLFKDAPDSVNVLTDILKCSSCRHYYNTMIKAGTPPREAQNRLFSWVKSSLEGFTVTEDTSSTTKDGETQGETKDEGDGDATQAILKALAEMKEQISANAQAIAEMKQGEEDEDEPPSEEEVEEDEEEEEASASTDKGESDTNSADLEKQLAEKDDEIKALKKSLREPATEKRGRAPKKPTASPTSIPTPMEKRVKEIFDPRASIGKVATNSLALDYEIED